MARIIKNPFFDYKNPEIQKKLLSWNKTCDRVARENEDFVRKQRKTIATEDDEINIY